MNNKDMDKAIYALSGGVIVGRKKGFAMPLSLVIVGVALLVINGFVNNGSDTNNLKSTLVLLGGLVLIIGIVLSCIRIFGGGAPYHKGDKCFLEHKRYTFDRSQQSAAVEAVEQCDKRKLDELGESEVASIVVECYYSPKGTYRAMQAFAYEELIYKEITGVKTMI